MAVSEFGQATGFWSYVHEDNENEDGRILELADRLKRRYKTLSGRNLRLFTDREIEWGAKWKEVIYDALTTSTFLIAIVTPSFLQSRACRDELLQFAENARRRDVPELLLSIVWVDIPDLDTDDSDKVKVAVRDSQFKSFYELSLEDPKGPEVRKFVDELARRLLQIEELVQDRPDIEPSEESKIGNPADDSDSDASPFDSDEPGYLDADAELGEITDEWLETVQEFQAIMTEIGEITSKYGARMTQANKKGTSAKVVVARQYATAVTPAAERYHEKSLSYLENTMRVNKQVIVILNHFASEYHAPGENETIDGTFRSIKELVQAGRDTVKQIEVFQTGVSRVARMSRDVRKPLGIIHRATQNFMDGQAIFDEWSDRIDFIIEDAASRLAETGEHQADTGLGLRASELRPGGQSSE